MCTLPTLSILSRLQSGDAKAFIELYTNYRKWLFIIAKNQVQDTLEAQDLVQELFADFWEQRLYNRIILKDGSKPEDCLKNYLFRCIRNRCLNHLTRKHLSNQPLTEYLLDQIEATPAYLPGYTIEKRELEVILRKAIEKIPKQSARVFALTHGLDKGRQEVARLLNISPNTVKNQLERAKRILRVELAKSDLVRTKTVGL